MRSITFCQVWQARALNTVCIRLLASCCLPLVKLKWISAISETAGSTSIVARNGSERIGRFLHRVTQEETVRKSAETGKRRVHHMHAASNTPHHEARRHLPLQRQKQLHVAVEPEEPGAPTGPPQSLSASCNTPFSDKRLGWRLQLQRIKFYGPSKSAQSCPVMLQLARSPASCSGLLGETTALGAGSGSGNWEP